MRLHPLSIPYRSVESGLPVAFAPFFFASAVGGPFVLPLVGLLVVAVVGYQVAVYRRFDYDLAPDTFDIRSGVLSRRTREIPLRRIQSVDISQNVVQRALGIAAVDFETAGGSGTEASLRYVAYEEAKRLQREIPRLKRGAAAEGDETSAAEPLTDDDSRELLFALSDRELALVSLLSFDFRASGLIAFVLSGSLSVVPFALPFEPELRAYLLAFGFVAVVVLAVALSWLVSAVVTYTNYYGFRLVRTADDLEYERGLLKRYTGSIPRDKIQTLVIGDDPLKRRFGYATLSVETAGYSPGTDGSRGPESAVPLATRERVRSLARTIEPFGDHEFVRPPERTRRRYLGRYLLVIAALVGTLLAVESVVRTDYPWYLPLALVPAVPFAARAKWRNRGYWLGEDHVATRNGFWSRRIDVVPYYRIQTVIDTRTIFQRRLDLATVTIDTAGSSSLLGRTAAAVDVDEGTADELRETLSARLRSALAARRS